MAGFDAAGERAARDVFKKLRTNLLCQIDDLYLAGTIGEQQFQEMRKGALEATDFDLLSAKRKTGPRKKLT